MQGAWGKCGKEVEGAVRELKGLTLFAVQTLINTRIYGSFAAGRAEWRAAPRPLFYLLNIGVSGECLTLFPLPVPW